MNPIFAAMGIFFFVMAGASLVVDWLQDALVPFLLHGVAAFLIGRKRRDQTRV